MCNTSRENPRKEIEEAIALGDLHRLLMISGTLHGHFCSFSALGVKAGARAMTDMGVRRSTGMEEIIAIVETNNCFSDGIQIVTGCSFGNNALVYRDFGKAAFTLVRRNGEGIRIAVRPNCVQEEAPEAAALFRKVIIERNGTPEDHERVLKLWSDVSFQLLDTADEKVFNIQPVKIKVPAYARIFASVKCSVCGEDVMEPRARMKDAKPVCLPCSGQDYYQLAGDGIAAINA